MFETRWYKSWPSCRRVIRDIRGNLHAAIDTHLMDKYCEDQCYCVVFHNKKPCGVLEAGIHKERGVCPRRTSFIANTATTRKVKGAGAALFDAFVEKYGTPFWVKCLDSNARRFWQHMGTKRRIPFRTIGRTFWGTAILYFG